MKLPKYPAWAYGGVFLLGVLLLVAAYSHFVAPVFPMKPAVPEKPTFTFYVQASCNYCLELDGVVNKLLRDTNLASGGAKLNITVVDVATLSEDEINTLNITRVPTIISSRGDRLEGFANETWALRWFSEVWNA